MRLASCKSALTPPTPTPVVYYTDRFMVVVLVLFLLFVALCSYVVSALFVFFFYMCCDASIVVTVFNSCSLCFMLSCFVVMLSFLSPSTAAHFVFCFTSCDNE